MRPPAPPSEEDSAAERQRLKHFIGFAGDAAPSQIAYWNAGAPAYRWIQIAAQEMVNRNVPAPLFTRGMALVGVAIYDASISAWDSKYAWERPHSSERDATIIPAVALPRSPSYPSEHAVLDAGV